METTGATNRRKQEAAGSRDHKTRPSQASVVVGGRGHLQDALSIVLLQGAPLHLPGQQQVLPIQRVDELHLHRRSDRGTQSKTASPGGLADPVSNGGRETHLLTDVLDQEFQLSGVFTLTVEQVPPQSCSQHAII